MGVKWAYFCNFRGPFFKKGGPQKVFELIGTDCSMGKRVGLAGRFAAILEHSGQVKKPGLELLQNSGCLTGETMTQTKKRKAIETVRGYKSSIKVYRAAVESVLLSVMFSNDLFQKKYLYLGLFLFAPHLTRQRKLYAAFFFQIAEIPQGRTVEYTMLKHNNG